MIMESQMKVGWTTAVFLFTFKTIMDHIIPLCMYVCMYVCIYV